MLNIFIACFSDNYIGCCSILFRKHDLRFASHNTNRYTFLPTLYAAAQDIDLARTEPDPQQLPCPQQTIQFQCRIFLPSAALIWDLPTGDSLEFGVLRKVGDVRNSSNNVYSATLIGKTEEDEHTDRFLFTSTLLVLYAACQSINSYL